MWVFVFLIFDFCFFVVVDFMIFIVIIFVCLVFMCLFNKLLVDFGGKFMIVCVVEWVVLFGVICIIVVIDYYDIYVVCEQYGIEVVMICVDYFFGIDCIVEVVVVLGLVEDEVVVNVQGDEFLIDLGLIVVIVVYIKDGVFMVMVVYVIGIVEDVFNFNVVKVVLNKDGCVMYFLCVIIFWYCDVFVKLCELLFDVSGLDYVNEYVLLCYIGLYVYSNCFLQLYLMLVLVLLECIEVLE